jgi:hypothetical protein
MSRVQIGEKIRLVGNDRETQEVIVEELIQRSGREFARVRFPDAHLETFETTYLKPEPSRPATDAETRIERGIQAANQALNELDRALRRPKVPETAVSAAPKRVDLFLTAVKVGLKEFGPVVVILCIGLFVGFYERVDSSGWVAHREDTTITAEPGWLVGESRECVSYPLDAGKAGRKGAGYAVDVLHCDNGPEHQMKVTFWGRLNQPEYDVVNWKCTRKQGGFTCYELSGYRVSHDP